MSRVVRFYVLVVCAVGVASWISGCFGGFLCICLRVSAVLYVLGGWFDLGVWLLVLFGLRVLFAGWDVGFSWVCGFVAD